MGKKCASTKHKGKSTTSGNEVNEIIDLINKANTIHNYEINEATRQKKEINESIKL